MIEVHGQLRTRDRHPARHLVGAVPGLTETTVTRISPQTLRISSNGHIDSSKRTHQAQALRASSMLGSL